MKFFQAFENDWFSGYLYQNKDHAVKALLTTNLIKEVTLIEGIQNRLKSLKIIHDTDFCDIRILK